MSPCSSEDQSIHNEGVLNVEWKDSPVLLDDVSPVRQWAGIRDYAADYASQSEK
jgi:hypothetical protein